MLSRLFLIAPCTMYIQVKCMPKDLCKSRLFIPDTNLWGRFSAPGSLNRRAANGKNGV